MSKVHPLTAYREAQNPPLTQESLAAVLGVSKGTVSRWEARVRLPDPAILAALQEKTGISPTELRPDLARHFPAQPEQARAS
jgi:transcriptional regulator with XRE-family HTH domain